MMSFSLNVEQLSSFIKTHSPKVAAVNSAFTPRNRDPLLNK